MHGLAQLSLDGPLPETDGRGVDALTDTGTRVLGEVFGRPPVASQPADKP